MKDRELREKLGFRGQEGPQGYVIPKINERLERLEKNLEYEQISIIGSHEKGPFGAQGSRNGIINYLPYESYKGTMIQRIKILESQIEAMRDLNNALFDYLEVKVEYPQEQPKLKIVKK